MISIKIVITNLHEKLRKLSFIFFIQIETMKNEVKLTELIIMKEYEKFNAFTYSEPNSDK